ncbi:MAG: glycosyltransferase [Deltaproteobacteria bacterium]|nr:glycosyltransferase [Deltaproteobacteria bacterium]
MTPEPTRRESSGDRAVTGATGLTLILPLHDEAAALGAGLSALREHLEGLKMSDGFEYEILLVENGSSDGTFEIATRLADPRTRVIRLEDRGLGLAIRRGIEESRMPWSMFYAIDVPFGTGIIAESLRRAVSIGPSMVIGSKAHPDSHVRRPLARSLVSGALSLALRVLFGLGVGDTQGSQLFWTSAARAELARLRSPGAFFQVQLVLAMQRRGLPVVEIPVDYEERGRASRMKIFRDSRRAFTDLWRERFPRSAR